VEARGERSVTVFADPAGVTARSDTGALLWSAEPVAPVSVMAPDGSLLASSGDPFTLLPGTAGSFALTGQLARDAPSLAGAVLRCEVQADLQGRGPLAYGNTRTAVVAVPIS
jgi:hypothetical protein